MFWTRIVKLIVVGLAALAVQAQAGTLSATWGAVPQGSTVDLTTEGKLDWVHWGLYTDSSLNRKSGVTPQISNYRLLDATNGFAFAYQYADNYNGYSWEDGFPAVAATNTPTGVWAYGTPVLESGFEISAPADTTVRILKVYVGVFAGTGRLRAFLTDGSAPIYTNCASVTPGPTCEPLQNFRNGPGRVYTIQYSADSPNQKLVVQWTLAALRDPTANVTLQAAALTTSDANNAPVVKLASPNENAVFAAGTTIECVAVASDRDGTIARVEFWDGASKLGESETSPYAFQWNAAAAGYHRIVAKAIDAAGGTRSSLPVEIFVHGTGGTLSGSMSTPPSYVDLTAEGTADWAHWGLVPPPGYDRKAAVAPQIGDFSLIGTNPAVLFTNYHLFEWTDGDPHGTEAGTGTGIYVTGLTNGFEFTVPADTTRRQLKVYLSGYGAQLNFQAFLSDASAPAYTDTSLDSVYDSYTSVFAIDYAAAAGEQKLIVRVRSSNLYDMNYGNVGLQSVALQGARQEALRILDAARTGDAFTFSVATQTGRNYSAEFSEALSAPNWIVFTNFAGTGGTVTVRDENPTAAGGFYRVKAE